LAVRRSFLLKFLVCRIDAIPTIGNPAVHNYVYKHLYTSNATSKETSTGRFRDLDAIAGFLITQHGLDSIHDVGVSSGVTSLELYRALAATAMRFSFSISDKYAAYGRAGRCVARIIDAEGSVKELYVCGMLGKREDISKKFPVTRFLYWLLADSPFTGGIRWFWLFDYEVQLLIQRGLISRIDYDVFQTRLRDAFSFVRCMNLLNPRYFSRESLRMALGNVIESIRDGGVLQIGRTHPDGTNHASFYIKRGSGVERLQDVGTGTELREIIAELGR
jgi:hypothetical protein